MSKPAHSRILLKLSGEVLAGKQAYGIDPIKASKLANEIKSAHDMGTTIILQPQVGILAIGSIRKIPSVIETDKGDEIAIRNKLFLSHTYDHRIIDGALGGKFAQKIAFYIENMDLKSDIKN